RKIDEEYWDRYRTTPKAFVSFETGRRLWQSRFGDRTSVRVQNADDLRNFADILHANVDPLALGVAVRDVRAGSLAASRGATDFGEYFTYFSFFLVVSALMVAALFFRLGIEQRAREIGLLRSVGFSAAMVRRLFLAEGVVLALCGALVGTGGAVGYAAGMMAGLRTWWAGAVGTSALSLHVTAASLAAGAAGALVASIVCIWWTLRVLSRVSERALLAGALAPSTTDDAALYRALGGERHHHRRHPWKSLGRRARRLLRWSDRVAPVVVFVLVGAILLALSFAGAID